MLQGERVLLRAIQREDVGRLWELSEGLELVTLVSPLPPFPTSRAALEAEFEKNAATRLRTGCGSPSRSTAR